MTRGRRWEAALRGGTRYHLPHCQALDTTRYNGEVTTLTTAQVAQSPLIPCALCLRAGMPVVPRLAVA